MAEPIGLVASLVTLIQMSSKICEYCGNVRNATDDKEHLRKEIERLKATLEQVQSLCKGPTGAELQSSGNLLDAMKDCERLLAQVAQKLDPRMLSPRARDKWTSRLRMHALTWPFKRKEVEEIMNKLRTCKDNISFGLQVDQADQAVKTHQAIVLNKLPSAHNAAFDSHAEEHHARCHAGTRVQLLQQIHTWADERGSECIFWLNGMAGTGKSTISRTVAQNFANKGELGATFFFKRGEGDRGHAGMFPATVAAQLVQKIPCVAPHVQRAIEADPMISTKALSLQFETLVSQPLEEIGLDPQKPSRIVIVIDALDECDREEDIRIIIRLLSQVKRMASVRLKFFVTSRPELPIRLGFENIRGRYEGLALHQIPERIVREDITVFLEHELAMIRDDFNHSVSLNRQLPTDWPGQEQIDRLVEMAIPLFIFAKTVCLFISDRKFGPPQDQLAKVLQYEAKSQASKLAATYLPVLNQLLVGVTAPERRGIVDEFQHVVGSIAVLASPLSATSLDALLGIPKGTVDSKTDFLHSVLDIPSDPDLPIRLLHLSFRDFLVSPEMRDTNPFWIEEKNVHTKLAIRCLRHLSTGNHLKKDICDLGTLETPRWGIDQRTIDAHIPSDVRYACQYWVYHLREGGGMICDDGEVYVFLERHFLHWLEALSLISRLTESISMIDDLRAMLDPAASMKGSQFLYDAKRFILSYRSIVELSPLQLYSSALIFAPMKSVIRNIFQNHIPDWISLKPKVEINWNAALQTLEGHCDNVQVVAFSYDSKLLASADVHFIMIWDVSTGSLLRTLRNDIWTESLSFSHDSKLLGSASHHAKVNIWDVDTGFLQHTCRGYTDWARVIAFSPNLKLLALGNEKTIVIWNISIDSLQQTFKTSHKDDIQSLAFSHDSELLASASCNIVEIWNISTDSLQQIHELPSHDAEFIHPLAFSHDLKLLALSKKLAIDILDTSTCHIHKTLHREREYSQRAAFSHDSKLLALTKNKTIKIWDISIDSFQKTLETHSKGISFLNDSKLLASADSEKVMIWDTSTGFLHQTLDDHNDMITYAISHDSKLLASADRRTIKIWNISMGILQHTLDFNFGEVAHVKFSPDSKLIALFSDKKLVTIWNTSTGFVQQTLNHSDVVLRVVFSQDSKLLASISGKKIMIWNISTDFVQQTFDLGYIADVIEFSPDSKLLASSSHNRRLFPLRFYVKIMIWNISTGSVQQTFDQSEPIRVIAFSHDSRLLALSGSETIKIWNIHTDFVQQTIAINDRISSLSFDSTNSNLLTNTGDIKIKKTGFFITSKSPQEKDDTPYFRGLNISESWIKWNNRKLLWLPPDYRLKVSISPSRSIVAIDRGAGEVSIIGFSSAILGNLLDC